MSHHAASEPESSQMLGSCRATMWPKQCEDLKHGSYHTLWHHESHPTCHVWWCIAAPALLMFLRLKRMRSSSTLSKLTDTWLQYVHCAARSYVFLSISTVTCSMNGVYVYHHWLPHHCCNNGSCELFRLIIAGVVIFRWKWAHVQDWTSLCKQSHNVLSLCFHVLRGVATWEVLFMGGPVKTMYSLYWAVWNL